MKTMLILIFTLALAGCATPNIQNGANSEPLTVHDANAARAMALQKIGETGDPETKRLAIFALVTMGQGQAAPQPTIVQGPRSIGDAVFGFLDRTLERTRCRAGVPGVQGADAQRRHHGARGGDQPGCEYESGE